MNGNDLMDALSGLDPKYIDEAAFELHGKPVKRSPKKSKVLRGAFIALPIAAALLITVMVALPALFRMGTSSDTSMPSDTGSYAPASEEAASDASASYEAAEEPSWDYEAAEEPSYEEPVYSAETEAAADSAAEDTTNASASAKSESAASTEPVASAEISETETAGPVIGAEYDNGILTIENVTLPEDISEAGYSIARITATGSEIVYSEGNLEDILTETEPLTLDISELALPDGTYAVTIGEETAEFTVSR